MPAEKNLAASPEIWRLRRRLAIAAALFFLSVAVGGYLWADWYFGLPDDAVAGFVGRQSCATCHQQQHEEQLCMQPAEGPPLTERSESDAQGPHGQHRWQGD